MAVRAMVKAVLTEFQVPKDRVAAFEAFMKQGMKRSRRAKGQLGAILLRTTDSNNYVMLAFWQTKRDREHFLHSVQARAKVRRLVGGEPKVRWLQTVARVQESRFLA